MKNIVINKGNGRSVVITVLGANGAIIPLSECTNVALLLWINGRNTLAKTIRVQDNKLYAELSADELSVLGEYSAQVTYTQGADECASERAYIFTVANSFYKSASGTQLADTSSVIIEVSTPNSINKGYSAYEVAVLNGFVGTEAEWLQSLKQPAIDAATEANQASATALASAQTALDSAALADSATLNANAATLRAHDSANLATEKANDAAAVAQQASDKIVEVNGKIAEVNTKIAQANDAIDEANQASATAIQSSNTALSSASLADSATLDARHATNAANAATTSANNAATAAHAAAEDAIAMAAIASGAADEATTAANNANTKATYAQSQGDYAKTQGDTIDVKIAEAIMPLEDVVNEVHRLSTAVPIAKPNAMLMTDSNSNGVWVPITNKEDELAYGIKENLTLSTPDCERTANLSLHKSLPLQRKMVTAIIRPDGTLAYYLHPLHHHLKLDGMPANLDGTDGYKMTYLPDMYVKEVVVGDTKEYLFSEYPLKGYTYRPGGWMSSYEATVDRTTNTLVSVKSEDVKYRGGNNNASLDALDTTQLGMCATAISNINFLAYARKNGANWVNNDRELHETLTWLIYSEFACFNNQKAVNNELSTEGYRQGGLGAGVTTVNSAKWDAFNKYYPLVKIGASDQLGNGTGEVEYTLPASFDTAEVKVKVPRYRGIENPFGHVWKWTSGILFDMGTEESKMYICNDPSKYGTGGVITSDYQFVGLLPRTEGYIKEFIGGFHIQPKQVGGGAGSGTYKCDYFYTNANTSQGVRGLRLGGSSGSGADAGCGCSYTYNAPTNASAPIGSRLCLKGGHRPTANEIDEILAKMI